MAKRQRLAAIGDLPPTLKPQIAIPNSSNLLTVSQPEGGNQKPVGNSSLICRFPNPNYQQPPPQQIQQQQQMQQQQQPPVLLPYSDQPQYPPESSPDLPLSDDPRDWSISQVISYLSGIDHSLDPHVQLFRSHEIDGNALLLLTTDMMMKYMDMRLGPALKIANIVNMIQGKKHQPIPK
jgi:hypothetical protein